MTELAERRFLKRMRSSYERAIHTGNLCDEQISSYMKINSHISAILRLLDDEPEVRMQNIDLKK